MFMALGTGSMGATFSWQGLFFLIGAVTIVTILAWLLKGVGRFAQAELRDRDGGGMRQYLWTAKQCAKREKSSKLLSRSRASLLVSIVVTFIVIERGVFEAAIPWHELLMVLGANSVAFMATELLEVLCCKAYDKIRAPLSKT